MNYEEFVSEVKKEVEKLIEIHMPEATVVIRTIPKNNNVELTALSIVKKDEQATPTIYLEEYYNRFNNGWRMKKICNDIYQVYKEGIEQFNAHVDLKDFENYENLKDRVFFKLINYEMNKVLLNDIPHLKYLDLAVVYYILVDCNRNGTATVLIHNSHIKSWGIEEEVLKNQAYRNTANKFKPVIMPMEEIITDMILNDMKNFTINETTEFNYEEIESDIVGRVKEEVYQMKGNKMIDMYVLTNEEKINGAVCMLFTNIIRNFSDEHKSDVYIIPSSIHELILIPNTLGNVDELNEIINQVNAEEVDPTEVLSDHAYIYRRDIDTIVY